MIHARRAWPANWFRAPRLPSPGLAFGEYPQRHVEVDAGDWVGLWRSLVASAQGLSQFGHGLQQRWRATPRATDLLPAAVADAYRTALEGLSPLAGLSGATAQLRGRLRREGLTPVATGQALALAALVMQRTQGLKPYDAQVLAAWLMLRGQLVEMATGEGKTVAAALAAGVAALAGTPVHVITANEYLVQRDQATMAPFFAALGLDSNFVTAAVQGPARHAAWRAAVVYSTAPQLAFDYLRDHMALGGERDARLTRAQDMASQDSAAAAQTVQAAETVHAVHAVHSVHSDQAIESAQALQAGQATQTLLPGLCMALIDEADNILLDEAVVPLILAAPGGQLDVAAYQRAYTLASGLQRRRDYTLQAALHRATLTAAGREHIAAAVAGAGGELQPPRRACELVEAALAARLLYRRDREYALVDGELQLIDALSGRIAHGRQWQGALHPMVQVKEGLKPSPPTVVAAQITYQRFFPRYLHLCGMSGTLLEARQELASVYGCRVLPVPLVQPGRRRWLGLRCYAHAGAKWAAVVHTVTTQRALGRPVLVGTDSVADSAALSARLKVAGVPHQLLNATQDQAEAEKLARAGRAGCVTVATNMAGRGTDIRLDEAATAAGGLHVVACMHNRARRIDRQLFGRAARHGDPGSAEVVVALDDNLLQHLWPAALLQALQRWAAGPQAMTQVSQETQTTQVAPGLARRPAAEPAGTGTGTGTGTNTNTSTAAAQLLHPLAARMLLALSQRRAEAHDRSARSELRQSDRDAAATFGFSGGTE